MPAFKDLTNKRFARLLAIGHERRMIKSSRGMSPSVFWICQCDCGNVVSVRSYSLVSGNTLSCGCWNSAQLASPKKHGMSKSITYRKWQAMKQRCYCPNYTNFAFWGGRGITVCDAWLNSFDTFYSDMGKCPSDDHSLDRIDNDGNYTPLNCRWSLRKEQTRNTRRNRIVTIGSESKTVAEWSEIYGVASRTIRARLDVYGWTPADAVTTPVKKH